MKFILFLLFFGALNLTAQDCNYAVNEVDKFTKQHRLSHIPLEWNTRSEVEWMKRNFETLNEI